MPPELAGPRAWLQPRPERLTRVFAPPAQVPNTESGSRGRGAGQLAATAVSVIRDWTSTGWPERADLIAANSKALHCKLSM